MEVHVRFIVFFNFLRLGFGPVDGKGMPSACGKEGNNYDSISKYRVMGGEGKNDSHYSGQPGG
jgi:hypothetical protein